MLLFLEHWSLNHDKVDQYQLFFFFFTPTLCTPPESQQKEETLMNFSLILLRPYPIPSLSHLLSCLSEQCADRKSLRTASGRQSWDSLAAHTPAPSQCCCPGRAIPRAAGVGCSWLTPSRSSKGSLLTEEMLGGYSHAETPCLFGATTSMWQFMLQSSPRGQAEAGLLFFNCLFIHSFIFDCAGSSLLHGLFSSCSEWGLLSSWGAKASHFTGFSCGAQALGTQASVAVPCGLSCPACGIFLEQGSNPCILHWPADILPLAHQGSPRLDFCKPHLSPACCP